MKIAKLKETLAVAGGLVVLALNASAQNPPPLPYGASEVTKLVQAKVNDDTIVAYIKSTRDNYSLSADQLVYLQQQGASQAVIQAMLNQARPGASSAVASSAPATATPPPQVYAPASPASTAVVAAPQVTYVQTVPSPYYYYSSPYYDYPYYGYYGWPFPGVALSFGWGWHGGWGGGGRGGFHGGGHR